MVIFSIPEAAVRTAFTDPTVVIASDGLHITEPKIRPRGQATFSWVLGHYAREEKTLALRKMTLIRAGCRHRAAQRANPDSLPARRRQKRASVFKDKGCIREGADADITVFDPHKPGLKISRNTPSESSSSW